MCLPDDYITLPTKKCPVLFAGKKLSSVAGFKYSQLGHVSFFGFNVYVFPNPDHICLHYRRKFLKIENK